MEWNWNIFWTAFSAIGVAVSAVVAFVAARISQTNLELSRKLLLETREMRLADNEAEVIIYIEPAEMQFNFLYLVLENVGPGVAYDVIIACKNINELPDQSGPKIRLEKVHFVKNKTPLVAPKQRFKTFVYSVMNGLPSEIGIDSLIFDIQYKDSNNRVRSKTLEASLSIVEGSLRVGSQSPLHDIEKHVRKIAQAVEETSRGNRNPGIDVYDKQDRAEEEKRREEYNAQQQLEVVTNQEHFEALRKMSLPEES